MSFTDKWVTLCRILLGIYKVLRACLLSSHCGNNGAYSSLNFGIGQLLQAGLFSYPKSEHIVPNSNRYVIGTCISQGFPQKENQYVQIYIYIGTLYTYKICTYIYIYIYIYIYTHTHTHAYLYIWNTLHTNYMLPSFHISGSNGALEY